MTWFLRIVLVVLVVRGVWRFLVGVVEAASRSRRAMPRGVPLVRDPVCGTYVTRTGAVVLKHGGRVEYFCSESCRRRFSVQ